MAPEANHIDRQTTRSSTCSMTVAVAVERVADHDRLYLSSLGMSEQDPTKWM